MRILIVGGGVSGLVSAVLCARNGHTVTVLEGDKRVGKKIAVSGNGRCNLDNLAVGKQCYNTSKIVDKILDNVTVNQCLDFWHSVGILTYSDSQGRIYPITDNSNSVVDCLRYQLEQLQVNVRCDSRVVSVVNSGKTFVVATEQGQKYTADKVILACGGQSQTKFNGDSLLDKEYLTNRQPSLTPIAVKSPHAVLSGIRQKCNVTLKLQDKVVATQTGEVLFREYGLSGICIMDLSAHIARQAVLGQDITQYGIELDLLPMLQVKELAEILQSRIDNNVNKQQLFLGILHNKLAEVVIKKSGVTNLYSKGAVYQLASTVKNFVYQVDKLCGFQYSQVTSGGVNEKYLDNNLTLPNGVAVLGEMLNVDGMCGGYNIHFATATAIYYCNNLLKGNN